MYCKECGNQIADNSKFCASCGKPQNPQGKEVVPNLGNSNADILLLRDEIRTLRREEYNRRLEQDKSKSKWIALLLCLFLGEFGAHRFYAGKTGTGILMLLFGLPSFILFIIATTMRDAAEIYGRELSEGASTFVTISFILVGIFSIWILIDLFRIITGSFIDYKSPEIMAAYAQNTFADSRDSKKYAAYAQNTFADSRDSKKYAAYAQNTFTDPRDGKKYKTVKIGGQVWMAENLNYEAEGSVCYENKDENCVTYGRLYNWSTAKKACPSGWHLPSDGEWAALIAAVGGSSSAGTKLKATSGWNENGNGTDEFGFSALPGGYGNSSGSFSSVGNNGYWWSATEDNASNVYCRGMYYANSYVDRGSNDKSDLSSVRCVQGSYEILETEESKPVVTQKIEQKNISLDIKQEKESSLIEQKNIPLDIKQEKKSSLYFISILLGIVIIIIIVFAIYASNDKSASPSKSTFTDPRDGKVYKTVKIGKQTWMAENLNYEAEGSVCYENKDENCVTYGRLYSWLTALKVCPSGWYLPSKSEYEALDKAVGVEKMAGKKLKAKSGWNENGNGTDEFGFSALPGGLGNSDGDFASVGDYGNWWSSSESVGRRRRAYYRYMGYSIEYANGYYNTKSSLLSVRCLQD